MKIRLHRRAERDLEDGAEFYEMQDPGGGAYFLRSIMDTIQSLRLYAGIHRVIGGKHRMLAPPFPFAVYYVLKDGDIEVTAILDTRRCPDWIRQRLEE